MRVSESLAISTTGQRKLIAELAASKQPVVLYGTGVYAYVLRRFLALNGVAVNYAVVNRKYKTQDRFMDLEVCVLEDCIESVRRGYLIVGITDYPPVISTIEALGIKRIYAIDIPDYLNMPNPFMDVDFINDNSIDFDLALNSFEDDLSKQTFIASINTKITEDLSFIHPVVRKDNLYFPQRESIWRNDEVFLDVGGYTGDTIREFHQLSKGRYAKIISLEPSKESFQHLVKSIAELHMDKAIALPVGAWDERKTLSFQAKEMHIDNQITEAGELEVEVDRIDDILLTIDSPPITLMKFDINGAERKAIAGAAETIRKDRPRIVTRLHTKEDYFKIPALLKEIAPDIKLYLRQRSYMSMMVILYGVFDSKF